MKTLFTLGFLTVGALAIAEPGPVPCWKAIEEGLFPALREARKGDPEGLYSDLGRSYQPPVLQGDRLLYRSPAHHDIVFLLEGDAAHRFSDRECSSFVDAEAPRVPGRKRPAPKGLPNSRREVLEDFDVTMVTLLKGAKQLWRGWRRDRPALFTRVRNACGFAPLTAAHLDSL